MGYLPEAMRNYLARLGWGHGDDEIFSDAQARAWFDVTDVVKAPARLDWAKLGHVNNHYIREAHDDRLAELVDDVHAGRGLILDMAGRETLARTIPLVKEGAKTLLELADLTVFALKARPLELDAKARGLLDDVTRERLGRLADRLGETADWEVGPLGETLRGFAESEGVGMGKFGPALRSVLSGGAPAPDLASALKALGREESLGRVADALSHVQ